MVIFLTILTDWWNNTMVGSYVHLFALVYFDPITWLVLITFSFKYPILFLCCYHRITSSCSGQLNNNIQVDQKTFS